MADANGAAGGALDADPPDRRLGLAGAPNARDLGGLPAAAGRRVRTGLVLRAGALGRLTDADVAALGRRRLALVIDLRHDSEITQSPPDRLPPGPRLLHLPVYDPDHPVFTYVSAMLVGRAGTVPPELAGQGTPGAMREVYRWFVSGEAARHRFAEAVRAIAGADGPVLFHCSAGKDRTGWLAALLLHAAGVAEGPVMDDYLLSNDHGGAVAEALAGALHRRHRVDPAVLRPLLSADRSYLRAAYGEAERHYGGMSGYLRDGLGLRPEELSDLRGRLLA